MTPAVHCLLSADGPTRRLGIAFVEPFHFETYDLFSDDVGTLTPFAVRWAGAALPLRLLPSPSRF